MALRIRAAHGCLVIEYPAARALYLKLGEALGPGQQTATAATADVLKGVHRQAFTV